MNGCQSPSARNSVRISTNGIWAQFAIRAATALDVLTGVQGRAPTRGQAVDRVLKHDAVATPSLPAEAGKLAKNRVVPLEHPGSPAEAIEQPGARRARQEERPRNHAVAPRTQLRSQVVAEPFDQFVHRGKIPHVVDLREHALGIRSLPAKNPKMIASGPTRGA